MGVNDQGVIRPRARDPIYVGGGRRRAGGRGARARENLLRILHRYPTHNFPPFLLHEGARLSSEPPCSCVHAPCLRSLVLTCAEAKVADLSVCLLSLYLQSYTVVLHPHVLYLHEVYRRGGRIGAFAPSAELSLSTTGLTVRDLVSAFWSILLSSIRGVRAILY